MKIGSLELLQASATLTLFNTSDPALRTGSAGQETASQVFAEVPDGGYDLVINEPAVYAGHQPRGHAHSDITNPALCRI